MFNEAGQPCMPQVMRGGGKGGGGGGAAPYTPPAPVVLTDPVNGKTFVDYGPGMTGGRTGYVPFGPGQGYAIMPSDQGGYTSAQDQLNAEISQRQAQEKADSDAAKAQAAQDAATKESTFQTNRQSAYDTAMQSVLRQFQLQGADPNQYMSTDITPALQRQFQSIQDLDPNPTAAFPTDLGQSIINNIVAGRRTQAGNALNQVFTPNYAENLLPDTLTSQYENDILNEQFNPLSQQLTNAQKRGTLTSAGYQAALDALNQKRTAAQSTVEDLGRGIINTDRTGINDYITGARNTAANLGLTDTFDPSTFAGAAGNKAQSYISSFGGALRNAVGDTKFADIQDLINAGGAVQGQNNPTANNPLVGGAGPILQDDQSQQRRGLGSTGAF